MTGWSSIRQSMETVRSVVRLAPVETDMVTRRLARAASVDDLRRIARRRLPRGCFDYIDGGAEDERTLGGQHPRLRRHALPATRAAGSARCRGGNPRARGVDRITRWCWRPPVSPASPIPRASWPWPGRRNAAGLPYTLSTLGTRSIEEVRAVSAGRLWFQVYAWRDRGLVEEMVQRAAAARYEALVLTVDTAVFGRRERDVRRGFSLPPVIGPSTVIDGMLHPAWTWAFVRSEPIRFANVVGRDVGDGSSPVTLADYINSQFDPALSWDDLDWLRSVWDGKIVVKGIQCVEDAVLAADRGVDAVALSNHGGRQLDGSPATFSLVAPVADAVGGRTEIICDGGVRRGSDIVKAVAAGATACMAGRGYLYALGAGGEQGVDTVLGWWREDVRRTMSLIGAASVADLDRTFLELA